MKNSTQTASATSKYIHISPTKIDKIIAQIRGKTYKEALQILKYLPQKSGSVVWQTLYSAVSNAKNNLNFNKDKLFIVEAFVNGGQITTRVYPGSRGYVYKIDKKMSHITIKVKEKEN